MCPFVLHAKNSTIVESTRKDAGAPAGVPSKNFMGSGLQENDLKDTDKSVEDKLRSISLMSNSERNARKLLGSGCIFCRERCYRYGRKGAGRRSSRRRSEFYGKWLARNRRMQTRALKRVRMSSLNCGHMQTQQLVRISRWRKVLQV
jgi:hypothetical protein